MEHDGREESETADDYESVVREQDGDEYRGLVHIFLFHTRQVLAYRMVLCALRTGLLASDEFFFVSILINKPRGMFPW